MTDHRNDEPDAEPGVPERGDSGPHAIDSGRHATNRNVVPRGTRSGDSGLLDLRGHRERDSFDVVTPVRAIPSEPHDSFDVDTPIRDIRPIGYDSFDVATPVRPIRPLPQDSFDAATPTPSPSRRSDASRGDEPDLGNGASRRPSTDRGHVEPRRRPTAPQQLRAPEPPSEPGLAPEPDLGPQPLHGLDRALRVATIVLVLGLGAAGLAQPTSVLRGGVAWLGFLFFVLAGWGSIVARVARVADPDTGQRTAIGAAGYLAVAGVLVAAGLLTRSAVLGLICVGFVGFAWREATAPAAIWHRVRDGLAFLRANPAIGAFVAVLVVLASVRMAGAVAALDRDPWDDDLAYTPFIKRLLDVGDLIEPFSFRRLGAYGGQTVLQALGAARGTLANVHLIDKGLGLGIVLLLITGHARERRTQPLWLALVALVVLVLPETAINTASYWTGAVMFLALYRCVVREQWPLVGLIAAATCTLRQNFLAAVAVFVACALIARLVALVQTMPLREAWEQERRGWAWTAGIALAVIVPWWIAAYLSSHTFLFPMFDGTWNHELSLKPAVTTLPQELAFLVTCCTIHRRSR